MQHTKERFSSQWGILLATIGMAVGTGNIWRFPRIAAQNGGGEFLIPWFVFLFLWGIPLLLAEFALGKSSRRGPRPPPRWGRRSVAATTGWASSSGSSLPRSPSTTRSSPGGV